MPKRKTSPQPSTHHCAITGCPNPGEHKAPRSRHDLREYQWLCTEHIREFNRKWDYFSGMTQAEIEGFMKDAVTGHRPTWRREEVANDRRTLNPENLEEALLRFMGMGGKTKRAPAPSVPPKQRKALAVLGLEAMLPPAEMKKHYRKLAKEHHPDAHKGDRAREETFKRITEAYTYLMKVQS